MTTAPQEPRPLLTRRRLLTAVGLLAVVTGVGYGWYWWSCVRLTAAERAMVGTWVCTRNEDDPWARAALYSNFFPDHTMDHQIPGRNSPGLLTSGWWVRGDDLILYSHRGLTWSERLMRAVRQLLDKENPLTFDYIHFKILSITDTEFVLDGCYAPPLVHRRVQDPEALAAYPEVAP